MGFNFRKSIKVGPARVNLSKSGVGYSVGAGGLRYTKSAKRGKSGGNSGCFGWLGKLILAMALLGVAINYIDVIVFLLIIAALVALVVFIAVKAHKKKTTPQLEPPEQDDETIIESSQ